MTTPPTPPTARDGREAARREDEAREWHRGLHGLDALLTASDPFYAGVPAAETHLTPCELTEDDHAAFADSRRAAAYFEELAHRAGDPALRRDAHAVSAYCSAVDGSRTPPFSELVRTVLGGTIELPTDLELRRAADGARTAFFAAFPDRTGSPYDARTVGEALAGYRGTVSAQDPRSVERFVDDVVTCCSTRGSPPPPTSSTSRSRP